MVSEDITQIIWWIGLATDICVGLMMLQVLTFRGIIVFRERERQRVEEFWQQILLESVVSVPPPRIPLLKKADAYEFLTLWNYLHESLHDTQIEKLNEAARMAKADVAARRFLKKTNVRNQLMAVVALGNLRDEESWDALEKLVGQPNTTLSCTAAQALMQIDAKKAIKIIMPLVASRSDWPLEAVSTIFKKAGADVISFPLSKTVILACRTNYQTQDAGPSLQHVPRLISLMSLAHPRFVTYVVRYILLTMTDIEVIAAALKVYDDPAILHVARQMLSDERWQIRVNAANAIGRTGGTVQDEKLLIEALQDKEWWVRYRAAQALASLPSVNLEKLENYAAAQTDDFARDILHQVMAERSRMN
jgi:hypothetical protein